MNDYSSSPKWRIYSFLIIVASTMGRVEAYASHNGVGDSVLDAIGMFLDERFHIGK